MTKDKLTIDFDIIWKKIHTSVSDEEEELLLNWIQEKQEHKDFFEQAKRFFNEGSAFDKQIVNPSEIWPQVSARMITPKRTKRNFIGWRVAIAAGISLVLVSIYVFNLLPKEGKVVAQHIIVPGETKATLTLNNGRKYQLSKGIVLDINTSGTDISSQGNTLTYKPTSSEIRKIQYNTVSTPRGGEFFVELSDGTKVWMNAETSLTFPVQFLGEERRVELVSGEAYFEVTKNPNKPFIVMSEDQQIEVLGTVFNVSAYQEDNSITTTLVEGKVNVFVKYKPNQKQILQPNQQSVMNKQSGHIVRKTVDTNHYTSWRTGKFYFDDQSLGEIMTVMARWYDIDVFFKDDAIKNMKFTGGFERYNNFEKIKNLIEKTQEVKFSINENVVIID